MLSSSFPPFSSPAASVACFEEVLQVPQESPSNMKKNDILKIKKRRLQK